MPRSILVVATANPAKLRELRALLDDLHLDLRSLADYPDAPPVSEDGATYLANARAKARAVAAYTRLPALADDSGLEVDALGGAPGVRSARFAAEAGAAGRGDRDNVALLLERLSDVPAERRTARFRCVIVVADGGRELVAEGSCEGIILPAARGDAGFGYDPVFLHPSLGRSFAELDATEKDRVSHRGRAIEALRRRLPDFLRRG